MRLIEQFLQAGVVQPSNRERPEDSHGPRRAPIDRVAEPRSPIGIDDLEAMGAIDAHLVLEAPRDRSPRLKLNRVVPDEPVPSGGQLGQRTSESHRWEVVGAGPQAVVVAANGIEKGAELGGVMAGVEALVKVDHAVNVTRCHFPVNVKNVTQCHFTMSVAN